ncbi:MAG: FkbM family methyltransferase [Patescibacteria group bacterium]
MSFVSSIRWKFLLAVFKLKRIVARILGTRELDYSRYPLRIRTTTLREYETRARSVKKEPKTVAWIERNAGESKRVLYDIGANIGAYSLIAGKLGSRVYAFEPGSYNFDALESNVTLNGLSSKITGLPIVLGAKTRIGIFTVSDPTPGSSHGFYNEAEVHRLPADNVEKRELLVMSLDDCVKIFELPKPSFIKIDVDGGEVEVLQGATHTLKSETLKSVLVEVEGGGRKIRYFAY